MTRRRLRRPSSRVQERESQDSYWTELYQRIKDGQVIPIISNSVRNDRIFAEDNEDDVAPEPTARKCPKCGSIFAVDNEDDVAPVDEDAHAEELTIDEELAEEWAKEIGYPMPGKYRLARVAVYNRIKSDDEEHAKRKYLAFLKRYLLDIADDDDDEDVADLARELRNRAGALSFSDIAHQLKYPRFADARMEDPLRLLARLPLRVYVTTSYYDFLERALHSEGRPPRTQICFLFGEPSNVAPEHRPDPDVILDPKRPLVYHLHGFEKYPMSLVLSEDDYLDFLARVSEEGPTTKAPLIPLRLSEAMADSSLILLGYRLHDWDFRVLFRGIIEAKEGAARLRAAKKRFGLAIQLDPMEQRGTINADEARHYLEKYFKDSRFIVEFCDVGGFIKRMYEKWNEWGKG